MDNRRLLLAFALSLAIVVLWGKLFPPAGGAPKSQPAVETEQQEQAPEAEAPPPAAVPAEVESAPAPPAPDVTPAEPVEAVESEPIAAAAEERPVITTGTFRAEFTNRGAELVSFQLFDQQNADGGPVDLVRARAAPPYPFAITDPTGGPSPLDGVLFQTERQQGDEGEETVAFIYRGPEGAAEKRFTFLPNGLFEVEVSLPGRSDWGLLLGPGVRNPTEKELTGRFSRRGAVYLDASEKVRRLVPKTETAEVAGAGLRWIGLDDTYFLTAVVPGPGLDRVLLKPVLRQSGGESGAATFVDLPSDGELNGDQKGLVREVEMVLRPAEDRVTAIAFWGSKQYERLRASPYGLELTIDLGWFRFLALPLLKGLTWIHDHLVGNYGWAIILMTVLIRLLLFPLTHKSTMSMQRMQEVNPKIQAIRQKWRAKLKDKQGRPNVEAQRKMNEEVMALYKAEGINPAGGCLPMLLQLPVFFAFYRLLSAAIELRHAGWLLWVKDLAAPDPFFVLPIVMGASQLAQQIMTPTGGDPMQRRMMMLMPIFLTVLFLGFPSGLVLYWLTSNLLGIVQQLAYRRYRERLAAATAGQAK